MRQIGSNHPDARPMVRIADGNVLDVKAKDKVSGLNIMDCVTFVLKVLRDGCNLKILQTDLIYKNGMDLSKFLLGLGWEAHFWSPDVYRKGNKDSDHTVSFLKGINAPKINGRVNKQEALAYKPPFEYYGVRLSGMIVGYNRHEPDTNAANRAANLQALVRLKKVEFCVGICKGGQHTFLMSDGRVWEVHWDGIGGSLYEITDFNKYRWLSGIVLTPPGSGFKSRPIAEIIAPIKKAESGFLCRNLNIFCK
jgi:hypothetical protein